MTLFSDGLIFSKSLNHFNRILISMKIEYSQNIFDINDAILWRTYIYDENIPSNICTTVLQYTSLHAVEVLECIENAETRPRSSQIPLEFSQRKFFFYTIILMRIYICSDIAPLKTFNISHIQSKIYALYSKD